MRDDVEVRIGARAFDLLSTLASRAGESISHAELIEAAWPKRVVADNNLKTQIAGLQRVLGLSPIGDPYVTNVALRGYVFVEEVHPVPTSQVHSPDTVDLAVRHGCTLTSHAASSPM